MSGPGSYVCAFYGRRDYYQIPLALAEAGMLECFLTDAYYTGVAPFIEKLLPSSVSEHLRFRHDAGIPADRVKCLWTSTVEGKVRRRLGYAEWRTFAKLDRRLSLAAAARANRTRSDLFLYQPYAWEAFTANYRHTPKKVMFQFHPHTDLERRILRKDSALYPLFHYSYEEEMGDDVSEAIKRRNRDCWRHADLIMCASDFTRRSLIEAGADARNCKIVPYGIDLPELCNDTPPGNAFHVLFVGSGTQRKGLHHLLLAWRMASLPQGSRLTVVCRTIDRGLDELIRSTAGVEFLPGVDGETLRGLFRTASLLAMPSLVEGFGQVYLEALAQGCPVLGTPNTCLPDLGASGAVFIVEAGAVDQLAEQLGRLARILPGNGAMRTEARACAARWPWVEFRRSVISLLRGMPAMANRDGADIAIRPDRQQSA